jgi:hypothetical protein
MRPSNQSPPRMESMMLLSDDFLSIPELDYEGWRDALRPQWGRYNPEAPEPKSFTGWARPRSVLRRRMTSWRPRSTKCRQTICRLSFANSSAAAARHSGVGQSSARAAPAGGPWKTAGAWQKMTGIDFLSAVFVVAPLSNAFEHHRRSCHRSLGSPVAPWVFFSSSL